MEEYFSRIPGVCDTECGYANGAGKNPTYEEVCSDTTGFAETVCILYNPDIVALRKTGRLKRNLQILSENLSVFDNYGQNSRHISPYSYCTCNKTW